MVATLVFTSLAKFSVGRLRPHFLSICEPIINGTQKEAEFCSLPENQHLYVENYTCSITSNPSLVDEARLSFFSGHSSLSMCVAVFAVVSNYFFHRFSGSLTTLLYYTIFSKELFFNFYYFLALFALSIETFN